MIATQGSVESSSEEKPLPPQFESIEGLRCMPNERLLKKPLVSVIGLVKDYQPPIKTKGSDFKCTITIVDLSTQEEWGKGIQLMIFWPEEKMPHISGACDIVIVRNFKVQMWSGVISLLANWSSELHVFHAGKIPPWPETSLCQTSGVTSVNRSPITAIEKGYAAWLFHHIDKSLCGEPEEFQAKTLQAMNVKEKFSLLKDVKSDHFYDLIGEVIQIFEKDGRVTMYLSDYTANSKFFNNAWSDGSDEDKNGDQYGYTKSKKKASNDWPGPYGKLSMQLTVYDGHATYIREQVKSGDWVILKNVQVKIRLDLLEGVLRKDLDGWEGKVQVKIIRRAQDAEMDDVRWKDGLRRKKEWWDKFKKQKQEYKEETEQSLGKRKMDDPESSKLNSKKLRKAKRAVVEQRVAEVEEKIQKKLDLNLNIKCNHPNKNPTPLQDILRDTSRVVNPETDTEYVLPFQNVKYRSNVRVIDFWPDKLEDFAVGRRMSEYDVLSDYSGGESTDNEEDMRQFRRGKGFGSERTWEWRFALQVEDASKKATSRKDCAWLVVDNQAAQMLLNMDAVSLRQEQETLAQLRETLFTLWGDLEEKKTALLKVQRGKSLKAMEQSRNESPRRVNPKIAAKPGDDLPPDSDDENPPNSPAITKNSSKPALSERSPYMVPSVCDPKPEDKRQESFSEVTALPVTNKGFTCCIQQYGIQVSEDSPARANAGEGLRWKRMFGLFGTMIS